MNNLATAPVFASLSDVIRGLRAGVAAWGGRGVLGSVLVLLVYRRFGAILRAMEGLAARFQAGRLWRIEGRGRSGAGASGRPVGSVRVWPGSFGWLVRAVGYEAAGFGSQLRALLERPEMVALLAASPQAVRVLRPMCRALAIETRVLRPGAEVVVRTVTTAVKRVRAPRVAVDLGRVPIPRGVVSAVRRGRFLRGG